MCVRMHACMYCQADGRRGKKTDEQVEAGTFSTNSISREKKSWNDRRD